MRRKLPSSPCVFSPPRSKLDSGEVRAATCWARLSTQDFNPAAVPACTGTLNTRQHWQCHWQLALYTRRRENMFSHHVLQRQTVDTQHHPPWPLCGEKKKKSLRSSAPSYMCYAACARVRVCDTWSPCVHMTVISWYEIPLVSINGSGLRNDNDNFSK